MEEKEYYQSIREDFRNFLSVVWEELKLPSPSLVQYDMADWLQHGGNRIMIQAMRGAGKSYMTSAYCVWLLYRNPDTTIISMSAVQNRAREFIRLCRRIIDAVPFLSHLVPDVEDRDGADRFDVGCRSRPDKNPSVAAYGIKSMVTGSHCDVIIADDIEIPQNSATVEARELLLQRCKELESVLNPGGQIVFLGTPQSHDSVYRHLSRSYALRKWTARYPDPDGPQAEDLSPTLLDRLNKGLAEIGDSTYPEYYPNDLLLEREAIMGNIAFQLQMMLDTSLSDEKKFPLHISSLIVHPLSPFGAPTKILWGNLNPSDIESPSPLGHKFYNALYAEKEIRDYERLIISIDPSGTGKDLTGVAVVGTLNGMVYILYAAGLPNGTSDETLKKIAGLVDFYNVKTIVCESNFNELYLQVLASHLSSPVHTHLVRATQQKEIRIISALEPLLTQKRIVVDPQVARSPFSYQMSHITPSRGSLKEDGIIDATAQAISYLSDSLGLDPVAKADRLANKEKERMVKEYLENYRKQNMPIGREERKSFTSMDRPQRKGKGFLRRY